MGIDFLLVSSWSDVDIAKLQPIAAELEASDYRTAVLAPTQDIAVRFDDYATETFDANSLAASAGRYLSPEEIEHRFGIPSLRRLCHTEQAYFHIDYDHVLRRARRIATAVDRLLSDHTVTYAYQGRGGELFRLLVHYGVTKHGGTNVWDAFSPFDETVIFSTHLDNRWNTYRTTPYGHMTPDQREQTREYMREFVDDKKRYTYDESVNDSRNTILDTLSSGVGYLQSLVSNDYPRQLPTKAKIVATRAINERVNLRRSRSLSESRVLCADSDFVFFPLQLPEESRLTVFSPEYYDQEWIIEYLSRSVPHGTTVVVKQHPYHIGQQSPRWIRRLSQLDNVEFIHPELNTHFAIKHADAVVVTNNTVGFETLFYETPLVVLGRAFYRETPAVFSVSNLQSLDETIADAVETRVDERDRVTSIYSLRNAVYEVSGAVGSRERAKDQVSGLDGFLSDI